MAAHLVNYSSGDEDQPNGQQKDANYEEVGMDMSDDEAQSDGSASEQLFTNKAEYKAYKDQFEKKSAPSAPDQKNDLVASEYGSSEYGPGATASSEYGAVEPPPSTKAKKASKAPSLGQSFGLRLVKPVELLQKEGKIESQPEEPQALKERMEKRESLESCSEGILRRSASKERPSQRQSREPSQEGHHGRSASKDHHPSQRQSRESSNEGRHHRRSKSKDQPRREATHEARRRRSKSKDRPSQRQSRESSHEGHHRRSKSKDRHRERSDRRRSRSRDRHQQRPRDRRRSRSRDQKRHERRQPDKGQRRDNFRTRMRSRSPPGPSKEDIRNRKLLACGLTTAVDPNLASKLTTHAQTQAEAQLAKVKEMTGVDLPKYYNPSAINPLKYAEQIKKRQMLWGAKKAGQELAAPPVVEATPVPVSQPASGSLEKQSFNKWEATNFGNNQVNEKFRRLMGIKGAEAGSSDSAEGDSVQAKQASLFASQEIQYERARAATHTQRGLGLGFSGLSTPSSANLIPPTGDSNPKAPTKGIMNLVRK